MLNTVQTNKVNSNKIQENKVQTNQAAKTKAQAKFEKEYTIQFSNKKNDE